MTDWQAALLGVVQGVTEFLPISSTAHLRIVPALAGWGDPGAAFTAVSQWGTFLAAVAYFRRDLAAILFGASTTVAGEGQAGRRLLLPIVLGTLPIVAGGVLFKRQIESDLRSLYVVGSSMILFGLLLLWAEMRRRGERGIESVTLADGLAVGIGQALALIPGASRSGTTITAALAVGLERATAARFSFLLSLPAVFLAGAKELFDEWHAISAAGMGRPLVVATVAAFLAGLASIDWLIRYLRRRPTHAFVAYRIVVGAAILALALAGRIR